jgi:hypothetical protein
MLGSADWAPTLLVLFRKSAVYGTTVWAMARAGLGVPGATAFVALQLTVLEMAQIFLPGRTAETTDPILAVVLGVILLQFDRKFGADPGVGNALPDPEVRTPPAAPRPATPGIWTGGRRPGL